MKKKRFFYENERQFEKYLNENSKRYK